MTDTLSDDDAKNSVLSDANFLTDTYMLTDLTYANNLTGVTSFEADFQTSYQPNGYLSNNNLHCMVQTKGMTDLHIN